MKSNDKNHYRVNWIDGMKINKDHFIEMENSILELVKQSEQKNCNPTNFGLLPELSEDMTSMDVSISVDGQETIEVVLNTCRAITLGGHQIEITKNTKSLLEQTGYILKEQYAIDKEEKEWFVVVTVNPFKRIPVGNADPEEEPPRHPHVFSEYKLDVLPKSETSNQELGLHHITIGKVILEDGKPVVDPDFIPPCRSIQSHPDLKFTYNEVGTFLNQMEAFSIHIIQKIHQKKQNNDLARMALHLSEQVMRYLNGSISDFRFKDRYEPPIMMISKIVNLGRVIKSSLDVYAGTGKEDFLNYLTDWCDLNQGAFEKVLISTIEMEYNHNDINSALTQVSSFTRLMLSLFKKLNELDYIGKKSNSGIFVKEEVVDNSEVKSRRSFLLD
ncbi:hypothetical protein [Ulvibacter litoralis]|uniref:Type VI secretion, VC_A0110, EvfL, ImpJ, VasE n=1 Tax=Ulvibacter litoralis TaxID=227084 RepID=A0A1G7HF37_9FLAO|nr:hypothetical protein [Ulvibacter litoralis]GHC57607.1 hypothetical protein GCM10008083_22730 [Ulvibacter litoralis]SDE99092.1 hypothetical protein SAMN05421855_10459 [Ulvibacter litoralis]